MNSIEFTVCAQVKKKWKKNVTECLMCIHETETKISNLMCHMGFVGPLGQNDVTTTDTVAYGAMHGCPSPFCSHEHLCSYMVVQQLESTNNMETFGETGGRKTKPMSHHV